MAARGGGEHRQASMMPRLVIASLSEGCAGCAAAPSLPQVSQNRGCLRLGGVRVHSFRRVMLGKRGSAGRGRFFPRLVFGKRGKARLWWSVGGRMDRIPLGIAPMLVDRDEQPETRSAVLIADVQHALFDQCAPYIYLRAEAIDMW